MNKERRKRLTDSIDKIAAVKDGIDSVKFQEEDALDNLPENFQGTDRYIDAEEKIDSLEGALSDLTSAIRNLEKAIS